MTTNIGNSIEVPPPENNTPIGPQDVSMQPKKKEPKKDIDLLIRKIDSQIDLKGQATSDKEAVTYSKLMSLATPQEKLMMIFGHIFSALTGAALPVFSYLMGNVFDSFGPSHSRDEQLNTVRNITIIFVGIGCGVWIMSYIYWYLLLSFSLRVSQRVKR